MIGRLWRRIRPPLTDEERILGVRGAHPHPGYIHRPHKGSRMPHDHDHTGATHSRDGSEGEDRMSYEISDVISGLNEIGEDQRAATQTVDCERVGTVEYDGKVQACIRAFACSRQGTWLCDERLVCDEHHPEYHSNATATLSERVTFNDLVQALEEALLQDGNRRKAMVVLVLARRQLDVDAWAERVLKDAKHRG